MKVSVKEIVLFAALSAILILSQVILSFIPNVELVTVLIIIYSLIYKEKTLYIVFIFVLMMGVVHGFGTWWFGYIIIWSALSIITVFFKKNLEGKYQKLSIFSGVFGFLFGLFYTIPNILLFGLNTGIAYYIAGIPYDFIHGISNYIIMLMLGKKIYNIIYYLNHKYFN